MARTIHDIRAGLIEEMHLLQTEVDERVVTIKALDRAIAALTAEMATPRLEIRDPAPEDQDTLDLQEGGNPFALGTVEFLCYEVLARTRPTHAMMAVVQVYHQVLQSTTQVISRDMVRQTLYNHPDVFLLVKLGWFRLGGR